MSRDLYRSSFCEMMRSILFFSAWIVFQAGQIFVSFETPPDLYYIYYIIKLYNILVFNLYFVYFKSDCASIF